MSSNLPPTGPPSIPPPPSGPPPGWQGGSAEVLQSGSGGPIPPAAPGAPRRPGGRRAGLVAGGALFGVGVFAAGAWAGYSMFFATGDQPAEALPASTVGYVSVDLDPSGRQKLEALRTLQMFPAFAENVDLDAEDDLRLRLFEEVQGEDVCSGLDFADDIDPWLGNRFAVAAIDLGGEGTGATGVTAVGVVQVDDAAAAEAGLAALSACGGPGEEFGWSVVGDWAVVAESTAVAAEVTEAAADAPLSADDDFQRWTDEAGDPGILTAYAAPAAGRLLGDVVEGLGALGSGFSSELTCTATGFGSDDPLSADPFGTDPFASDPFASDPFGSDSSCEDLSTPNPLESTGRLDQLESVLDGFEGAALTVRFSDGGLELETASGSSYLTTDVPTSSSGDDVVTGLPADTAAVLGLGLAEGWFDGVSESAVGFLGEDGFRSLLDEAEAATGLNLREDVETVLGTSTALVLGGDADLMGFQESEPPTDLELAVVVEGDAPAIGDVLDRLVAATDDQSLTTLLGYDAEGDVVAVGPSQDYRSAVLSEDGLGDTEAYRDAVIHSDDAGAVLFVNFDAGSWLASLPDLDEELRRNLAPLSALGLSSWVEDDVSHAALRITTE